MVSFLKETAYVVQYYEQKKITKICVLKEILLKFDLLV